MASGANTIWVPGLFKEGFGVAVCGSVSNRCPELYVPSSLWDHVDGAFED